MGSGLFGTSIGHGFFGFDPTPGFSATNTIRTGGAVTQGGHAAPAVDTTPQLNPAQAGAFYQSIGASSPQVLGDSTTISGAYGGASGSAAGASGVNNQPLYDLINGALGRLPGQLQTATNNIQHMFDQNSNELQSGYDTAKAQNAQATTQNQQQFRLNKNQIADQASSGVSSLMRLLGAHGAGGSSDAMYVAPQLVAQNASQQRAGAGQTFGQNQQGIDTNWGNYQSGFDNSKKKLNDWLSGQIQGAQAQSAQTELGLRSQLPNPDIAAINGLNAKIDSLGALNPTYDGKTPTFAAPSVASYNVNPQAAASIQNSALDSATSPFLSLLLGQNKDKNQNISNLGF